MHACRYLNNLFQNFFHSIVACYDKTRRSDPVRRRGQRLTYYFVIKYERFENGNGNENIDLFIFKFAAI